MALIPEYPFQRTRLQPQPIIPAVGAAGLAQATNALDRGAAMLGAEASSRANQAEARSDADARSAIARKEANAEAEAIALAKQEGQNAVVRDASGNYGFVPRDNSTAANRAYNAQHEAGYFSSLQVDWRGRLATLSAAAADDPEKFRVTALRSIEEAGPQIDERVRGEAQRRLRQLADDHYAGLLHARAGADRQLAERSWHRQRASLIDDVNRLAEGGQIGTPRYADAARQLEGHLTAGVGARFIDEASRDLWRRETADEATARALGAQAVREFTQRTGPARSYAETVQALESPDGRPNALGSGAAGPYQIMPQLRAQFPAGTPDAEILERFTENNRRILADRIGREPSQAELFMAHRLGAGGALALLRAEPNTPIADALRPVFTGQNGTPTLEKVLAQNPYLGRGGTAGGVIAQVTDQWQRASGQPPSAARVLQTLDEDLLQVPGGDRVRNQVLARARSDIALAEGQRRQDLAELQQEAQDGTRRLHLGYEVAPDLFEGYARRARALGDTASADRYDRLAEVQGTLAAARGQPVAQLQAQAEAFDARAQADTTDVRSAELARGFARMAASKDQQLRADPLTYGARVHARAVGPLVAIDWANPEAAQATLRDRNRQAGLVSQTEGVPVSPLTAPELATLKTRAAEGTAEQRAAVVSTLLNGLGPQPFRQVLAQLDLGNDRQRGFAVAAAVAARGDSQLATEILQGADVLRENSTVGWQRPEFDQAIEKALGGALAAAPQAYGAIRVAVRDLYAARAFGSGNLANATFKNDLLTKAVTDVTGGVLTFNGGKLIAPTAGMTQADFDRVVRAVPPARLDGAMAGNGVPFTQADLVRDGHLQSRGDGRYFVNLRGSGLQIRDRAGERFILDLRPGQ
jgi:hypothetical protein